MFIVQIGEHDYGKVESLQVAMDFCLFRLSIAKRNGIDVTAVIKSIENCGNGWTKIEVAWSCAAKDVMNFFEC